MEAWTFDGPYAGRQDTRRQVHGRIYELITDDPLDGDHPYVGMTRKTIHQRVHGQRGHTSRESVSRNPWKARILPGAAGYRQLEAVYDTGDPVENDRALRRAEAAWIDRLRPTHNIVRPVRPPLHEVPVRRQSIRRPAPRRLSTTARAARRRVLTFVTMVVVCTAFFAVQFAKVDWDRPATPWIAAPVFGLGVTWLVYFSARDTVRRIKRKW